VLTSLQSLANLSSAAGKKAAAYDPHPFRVAGAGAGVRLAVPSPEYQIAGITVRTTALRTSLASAALIGRSRLAALQAETSRVKGKIRAHVRRDPAIAVLGARLTGRGD
jgi:hypothetical protein